MKSFTRIVIFLFISSYSPISSIGQQHNFIVKVHFAHPFIKTLEIGEAYYFKLKACDAAEMKIDSASLKDDYYLFKGTILYPTAVRMYPSDTVKFNQLFFIDTGYQEINVIKKNDSYILSSTSAIEKEHLKFLKEMNTKTIDEQFDEKRLLSYVEKNPNSYVALFAIINQAFRYPYPTLFEKINKAFGNKIQDTRAFEYYSHLYSPNTIGSLAPDFSLKSCEGKEIKLSSFRKQVVLLDFWASWCAPCRQMMPYLKNIYKKYSSKGLEIISISADRDTSSWKKALREEHMPWKNVLSGYGVKDNLDMKYNVLGYPTIFLIDKEGVIYARFSGDNWTQSDLTKKLLEKLR